MHIVVGVLALIGIAYFWMVRMRAAAEMTQELAGVAGDVVNAARRFGFRRKHNQHPVDAVDEPKLAIGGAGLAFLELSGLPNSDQHDALLRGLQSHLGLSLKDAEEAAILGRWLVSESGGAEPGFARLTRRLRKIAPQEGFEPLMGVLNDVAGAARDGLSEKQKEALQEVTRAFRLG